MAERDRLVPKEKVENDGPNLAQNDWEAIGSGDVRPRQAFENGDIRYGDEPDGQLAGEDDDNAYQESDEALPDDAEEVAIGRNQSRDGGRFDET